MLAAGQNSVTAFLPACLMVMIFLLIGSMHKNNISTSMFIGNDFPLIGSLHKNKLNNMNPNLHRVKVTGT